MSRVFLTASEAFNSKDAQFVDCRHLLSDPTYGKQEYLKEHISGAIFAHLDDDLSGPITPESGRHPLPDINNFHHWLQSMGLTPNTIIIVYDNFEGGIGARLWWMLKQMRYKHIYIMTDSLEIWKRFNYPTQDGAVSTEFVPFELPIQDWEDGPYSIKYLSDIRATIPSNQLIDSRSPDRYRGENEPYDKIKGRIPGAINLYWQENISGGSVNSENIRDRLRSLLDLDKLTEYTIYCGSGVTACFNLAIFEELGLPLPSFYPGSYSEWSTNYPEIIQRDV